MEPVMDHDDRPTAFSVRQFCEMHAIGRTTFYEEVKYGRLRIRKRLRVRGIQEDDDAKPRRRPDVGMADFGPVRPAARAGSLCPSSDAAAPVTYQRSME